MKLKRDGDPHSHDVELISRDGSTLRARIGDREVAAEFLADANAGVLRGTLTIDGRRYAISGARRKESIIVGVGPASFEFKPAESGARRHARGLAAPEITAPMPGKVLKLMVEEGDAVEAGQPLVVIEAMKMETTLSAESAAIVKRVRVAIGEMVDHGAVLIELSPPAADAAAQA
ncbi:MAG: biotin/lipoyl-containing protein [Candidatus Binatus sp.]|uniref:acetyl-CoA carboxylase biotin carboxyl carrier protein subunit n=1 Tax=Candidatus Binatus sp. TaxID=2811406 RepID=UPI002721661E|nr:biotin/lipoyl-containing protein [Candidatus Binatus sp.]MDO8432344.1 biotin/lipoyl-containing protein [Candidatus Binatus sp.]